MPQARDRPWAMQIKLVKKIDKTPYEKKEYHIMINIGRPYPWVTWVELPDNNNYKWGVLRLARTGCIVHNVIEQTLEPLLVIFI